MSGVLSDRFYLEETIPDNLNKLRSDLLAFFKLPPDAIGIRGDSAHLRGYHRSRNFILNSPFCSDRGYSVTAGVNQGGDANWIAAMDISLPTPVLMAVCGRLNVAVLQGHIEKIVEWFGNLNGDTRVDGYDNIANTVATSDASHLWHLHLSFARSEAGNDHTDVFNILTGTNPPPLPATPTQAVRIYDAANTRVVATVVPAGSGITNWEKAFYHWYRTPAVKGSTQELEHIWRFRLANFSDAGRWDTLTPGVTTLSVPRTLGY